MNPAVKGILAVISGIVIGSVVNMAIITIGPSIIPPPEGADVTTMEGLKATLPLFEPKNFLMPFLDHALGTLGGALIAALIAAKGKLWFAMSISFLFLIGGIMNVVMLPSPLWFTLVDLLGAYLPMGYLGWKLAERFSPSLNSIRNVADS